MSETKRRFVLNAFKVFDLALLVVAFGVASMLSDTSRGGVAFVDFLSMKVTLGNVLTFAVLLPTWHLIFLLFGLYESKRLATRSSEMIDTAKATTLVCHFPFICLVAVSHPHGQLFFCRAFLVHQHHLHRLRPPRSSALARTHAAERPKPPPHSHPRHQ